MWFALVPSYLFECVSGMREEEEEEKEETLLLSLEGRLTVSSSSPSSFKGVLAKIEPQYT